MQGKVPTLAKMTHKFFLRRLEFFAQAPTSKPQSLAYQQSAFIKNFQAHFNHYSTNKPLVDSFMSWLSTVKTKEKGAWEAYGQFVMQNAETYSVKNLIHISELLERHEKTPKGFYALLESRLLADLQSLSTKDIALVCRQTKSDALMRKVKAEGRIIINNEYDLFFFTSAYLSRVKEFPDVVDNLQAQLARILPNIKSPQTLCKILKLYASHGVALSNEILATIEATILSQQVEFRPLDISEVLQTYHSMAYHNRVSESFWKKLEEKITARANLYSGAWLLSTMARYNFLSETLFATALPMWISEVEKQESTAIFREGFCAVLKFPGQTDATMEWMASHLLLVGGKLSAFDVSTMLRSIVVPGWYHETVWQLLLERFFSSTINAPKDIDKAMVYFALKSLEIDAVPMRYISRIVHEHKAELKAAFEKTRHLSKDSKMHFAVADALRALKVDFGEFENVCEIYTADFVLRNEKLLIVCYEWSQHMCVGSKHVTLGAQMMLRHLNKIGWKVIIAANANDLQSHLQAALESAAAQPAGSNFHIV